MFQDVENTGSLQVGIDGDNSFVAANALNRLGKFTKKKVTGLKTDAKNVGKGVKQAAKTTVKATKQAGKFVGKKVTGLKTDMANIKKAIKTDMSNAWKLVKKYSPVMVVMRTAFRGLVRVNLWALASDIKKLKDESEKGNAASKAKFDKIISTWEKFGGSKSELIKTAINGAKNPIVHKERKSGADGSEYCNAIEWAAIGAAVASSTPIIVKVIDVVGKNKNNAEAATDPDLNTPNPERDAALAAEQAQYQALTPEEKAAFQATTAGDPIELSTDELKSVTNPDGSVDKVALAKLKVKSKISSSKFPVWGYAAIGGGVAIIGSILYLITRKK